MKNILQFLLLTTFTPLFFMQCAAAHKLKVADKNAETVRIWFEEGWNKKQNDGLIERVFSPDWVDGNPIRGNQAAGLEGIRETVHFYEEAFAETHFTITHLFATDKQVVIRYDVTAVHIGEAFGIPKTGKRIFSSGIVIYDMYKGKIKRSWQELDVLGIINQLKAS